MADTSSIRVRFAPSPTGRLHVGNARVALVNWLLARRAGGQFVLRMDDTDAERSTAAFERAICEDLRWLGLEWDAFVRQSDRLDRYAAAVEALKAAGRLYPCYETPEELGLKRKVLLGQGRPPIYDRAALKLDNMQRRELEARGIVPHWRFQLDDEAVAWDDLARGPVRFEPGHLSDPVLLRADGRPLYTLSSVVDDGELAVSHVVRGEDHVANTAVQVQLFAALGFAVPCFAHLPLLTDAAGHNLSKRIGSLSLAALREQGIEPRALAAYLAHLGTPVAASGAETLDDLARDFDIGRFGRAAPKFDPAELERLNARALHAMPFSEAAPRLRAMGLDGIDDAFWQAIRPNIARLDEAAEWWRICRGAVDPVIEDSAFCAEAARLLPAEPWGEATFEAWMNAVKQATGRKGKALFLPLRRALTGQDHGPELKALLPLIGRDRAVARLTGGARS